MKSTIIILSICTFYVFCLFAQETELNTIRLKFDGVDTPPACFISNRLLYKPKVGLALSGGGARCIFQIGTLQILQEYQIQIDYIVGVSMGAIIGGFYSAGYSPLEIENIIKQIKWDEIIYDTPPRTNLFIGQKEERDRAILQLRLKGLKPIIPQSFTAGQTLSSILNDLTMRVSYPSSTNFDKFKTKFRALACDLVTGQKVLIGEGNLAEAMKASSAFPLLFAPVQKNGSLLVDGGLLNNIPVDEVKEGGVDIVLAVNTTSNLNEKDRLAAPWIIADQVTTIMQREKKRQQENNANILIKLHQDEIKSDNFNFIDTLIQVGRNETLSKIDSIRSLIENIKMNSLPKIHYRVEHFDIITSNRNEIKKQVIDLIEPCLQNDFSYYEIYSLLEKIFQMAIFQDVYAEVTPGNRLLFFLVENPSFHKIEFTGNTVFSDSMLQSLILSSKNKPINYYQSKNDIASIIDLYKKNGYTLAQIKHINLENGILRITIDEGNITKILIQGNQRTNDYVVLREFSLKPGDIFNINKASDGIINIHSTDLFSNVSWEIKNACDSNIVVIKLNEKAFSVFRLGTRYDLEHREKSFIEIMDENIFGSANRLSLLGIWGFQNKGLNLQLKADRIFQSFFTYQFNVFYTITNEYTYSAGKRVGEYNKLNQGLSLSIGQQIKRFGMLSAIIRFNSTKLSKASGTGFPIGDLKLKSFALQSIIDTRNKYPFPTKGKYYRFFYEISNGTFLNNETSYFKIFSSLETFYTFLNRNTIHPKIIWGASDLTTPYSEQFRLGGLTSLLGLNENEYIGKYIFLSSLEYRYFFPFKTIFDVYWSFRVDLGSTWRTAENIQPKDVVQGLGTGIAIHTFLGPVNLFYGWNDRGKHLAYFSAGFEF